MTDHKPDTGTGVNDKRKEERAQSPMSNQTYDKHWWTEKTARQVNFTRQKIEESMTWDESYYKIKTAKLGEYWEEIFGHSDRQIRRIRADYDEHGHFDNWDQGGGDGRQTGDYIEIDNQKFAEQHVEILQSDKFWGAKPKPVYPSEDSLWKTQNAIRGIRG